MLIEVLPLIICMLDDWLGPPTISNPAKVGGVKRSALPFTENVTSNRSPVPTSLLSTDAVNLGSWAKTTPVQNSNINNMEYLNFINYQSLVTCALAPFSFLFFSLSCVCFSLLFNASSIRCASSLEILGCCCCCFFC